MQSKSEKTRQFIIEKSSILFNKNGFSGTSLTDILQATKLTKGCIYGHFESKEAIALECFSYAKALFFEQFEERINSNQSAKEKLYSLLNFYHNYSIYPVLEGGCILLNSAVDCDVNFPILKEEVATAALKWLNNVEKIIENGINKKEFHKKVDPKIESRLLFSSIHGGIMMSRLLQEPAHLNEILVDLKKRIKKFKK